MQNVSPPVLDESSPQSAAVPAPLDEAAVEAPPEAPRAPSQAGFGSWLAKVVLKRLLASVGNPPATWVLWNGEEIHTASGPAEWRITVSDQRSFWKIVADPYFQFAEAYADGRIQIKGKLLDFLQMVNRAFYSLKGTDTVSRLLALVPRPPRRNTLSGSRENIHHHYDIGNDFYRLWLDEEMVYTCAYFADSLYSLEQAQLAKLEHVCRKVWLRPGESVVEAGCGWGALALYMARKFGVRVRAFNISHEQVEYARERAAKEGLSDRIEFIEDDWRNVTGRYDAFVSVGMLEHVGVKHYAELGEIIHRSLNEHGRGLVHTIGQNRPRTSDPWIERRIFPGAYPPALSEMMKIFEAREFSVLDVENLRLHYAQTLRHWLARFEQAIDVVREMFDERFVRMWRLYLAGSCSGFETGGLQLFQVVFAPGKQMNIPRNRAHQYGEGVPVYDQFFAGDAWWSAATS